MRPERKKWVDRMLRMPENSATWHGRYSIVRREGDSFDLYREGNVNHQYHIIKKGVTAEEAANEIFWPF